MVERKETAQAVARRSLLVGQKALKQGLQAFGRMAWVDRTPALRVAGRVGLAGQKQELHVVGQTEWVDPTQRLQGVGQRWDFGQEWELGQKLDLKEVDQRHLHPRVGQTVNQMKTAG